MDYSYKLSKYIEVIDLSKINGENQVLLFPMRSGKLIKIKKEFFDKLQEEYFSEIPQHVMFQLIKNKVLVAKSENETTLVLNENDVLLTDNKNLYFVIQPGANCQLGCHYCGQTHTNKFMNKGLMDKVIMRIESKIKEKYKPKRLSITWYGAEPLLAMEQIRYLTPKLIDLCKKYNLEYNPDIITNGLGLKENLIYELIDKHKIRIYQITLDGTQEFHDKRRYTKSGHGTFNIILKNILSLIQHPSYIKSEANLALRINIDKTNQHNVVPFLRLLVSKEIEKQITISFAPIVDWGGNNASQNSLDRDAFASEEMEWVFEALRLGFTVEEFLPDRGPACMVVNPGSEVYDAEGYITPCYEMNYTKMYKNTEHIIGNLISNKYQNKPSLLRNWHKDIIQNYPCYTCKYLPVCGGSCPKNWIKNEPTCPSFKYNLSDRLVLDYLNKKGLLTKELIEETYN